jgi:hypothetical protein
MKNLLGVSGVVALGLVLMNGCTVQSNEPGGGGGTSGGSSSSSSSSSSGGGGSSSGGTSGKEVDVSVNGACQAPNACGGALEGTFDYVSGCAGDVFAEARRACPTVDTSGVKVTVAGSLAFSGQALERRAVTKLSGSIVLPVTCTSGQCAMVQQALASSFDSVSCTGIAACTCVVSKTERVDSATTFTVSGNVATTADGERYDYCTTGRNLTYAGRAGAESGVWTLSKR